MLLFHGSEQVLWEHEENERVKIISLEVWFSQT